MKIINIVFIIFVILSLSACNKGIDPISEVAPGGDETAPKAIIKTPANGQLRLLKIGNLLEVDIEVIDDIELESVSIILDGTEISNITDFKDYRRYAPIDKVKIDITEIGLTSHTLKIMATDKTGKTTSSEDVSFNVLKYDPVPKYGEVFYMNFDDHNYDLIQAKEATMIGTTNYNTNGMVGSSFAGAADSYLSFPADSLMGTEFSATFWYNVNSSPDRSGILTIGPATDGAADNAQNNRTSGFRLFREGGINNQIIKLNVGDNTADGWFDGGAAATLDPDAVDWVHIAFTISETHVTLYINGIVVSEGDFGPIGWNGCDIFSIGSGAPRFTEWGHLSDQSLYDELRVFDKALTQIEIQTIIDAESAK